MIPVDIYIKRNLSEIDYESKKYFYDNEDVSFQPEMPFENEYEELSVYEIPDA